MKTLKHFIRLSRFRMQRAFWHGCQAKPEKNRKGW
ncbi:hypothetical protein CLS_23810 [[Clostridium] cf. saccharolyticum K10]|nr:hypothetical protein CLS_23810 [[Clostridium] cf. saccharolyticum K10]